MTAHEITGWRPHLHGVGLDDPRRVALIAIAVATVVASLWLFPPDTPFDLAAAFALLLGFVLRRLPLLAESLFVLAATSGWPLLAAAPGPVSFVMWLALPLAAVLFEPASSSSRTVFGRVAVVAGIGAAIWITALTAGWPDWESVYKTGPVAALILVARRYARTGLSLVSRAREERAEQRRVGVSVPLLTALLDQSIPGRTLSRLAASETARSSVATELHAEVMPRLVAVIRSAERIGATDLAVEARELGETVRTLMSRDRPVTLETLGFPAAIESLGQEIGRRHGLALTVDVESASGEPPTLVARAAYRSAQEWLENVGRHAGARSVRVTGTCQPTLLELRVTDDGRGFDPGQAAETVRAGHLGLTDVRAETAAVGARLEIRPLRSGGTEMLWRWER